MPRPPRRARLAGLVVLPALVTFAGGGPAKAAKDPLADEVARWAAFLTGNPSTDELWTDVKKGSEPALLRTEKALREGRRQLALQRLASVGVNLGAAAWLQQRTAEQRKEGAAFEAEWARMGEVLRADLGPAPPAGLEGVSPAATRALGEATLPQVREFYEASLEYGRNTMPEYGLFYLGAAQAARDFVRFSRTLSAPSALSAPPVRALGGEILALEGDLLAAYRPPASIDKHPEFIAASSSLNEARALDAAGLRYGALVRYLQAALRSAPLRSPPPPGETVNLEAQVREQEACLAASPVDHSIARIFLESAAEDGATAAAVLGDVLPRYFAALEPPRPAAPRPPAEVTVTLVRWPFT